MGSKKKLLLLLLIVAFSTPRIGAESAATSPAVPKEDIVEYRDQGQTDATPRVNILLRVKNQKGELIPCLAPDRQIELTGVTVKYGNGFEGGTGLRLSAGATQTSRQLQLGAKYKLKLADGAIGEFTLPATVPNGEVHDIIVVLQPPKAEPAQVATTRKWKIEGFDGEPQIAHGAKFAGWSVMYLKTGKIATSAKVREDGSFVLNDSLTGGEAILFRGGDWQLYVPKLNADAGVLKKDMPGAIAAKGKSLMYKVKYDVGNEGADAKTKVLGFFLTPDAQLPVSWNQIKEAAGTTELSASPGAYTVQLISEKAGGERTMHRIDEVKLTDSDQQIELKKVERK